MGVQYGWPEHPSYVHATPSVHDIRTCPILFVLLGVEGEQRLIVDGIGVDDLCRAF